VEQRAVWADRYAIFDEIAAGGMATVYLAGRLGRVKGDRVVAVKKLFEQYAREGDFVAMFLDEARLAARIHHPNVIKTYQVLRVPASLAIVMELVVGASLVDLLKASKRQQVVTPIPIAGAVLVGALLGLHAAHEAKDEEGNPFGLVHRDVSPHNILVGSDGRPRVIDFGVAKAAGQLHVTDVGVRKGKFAYMAPEQIRGRGVDRRTDVYAAGLVLWEVLVGKRHYSASSDVELLSKRATGEFVAIAPNSAGASVPDAVNAVVLRALELDPDNRYATAEEMAQAVGGTLGVASPAEVAAWVDSLAHERIAELAAKVKDVEAAFDGGDLEELEEMTQVSRGATGSDPNEISVVFDAPDLDLPEPARARPPAPPSAPSPRRSTSEADVGRAAAYLAEIASTGAPRPPSPAAHGGPSGAMNGRSGSTLASAGAPGPTRVAQLQPAALRHEEPPLGDAPGVQPRPLSRLRTLAVWSGALVVIVAAVLVVGPSLLRLLVVRGAAKRGVALTFDHVALEGGGLTLSAATFRVARESDVAVDAPVVHVGLDWGGTPESLRVPEYTLTLRGGSADLAARLGPWASSSLANLTVDGDAGHLNWSDSVAPGIALATDDLAIHLKAGGPDTFSLSAATHALTARVRGAPLGPWDAHLDIGPDELKLSVGLDRAHPDAPPSLTLAEGRALGRVFALNVPRTKAAQIGVPATFLALGPDPEVEISLQGQVFPSGEPLNAHLRLGLSGVTIPALSDPSAPAAFLDVGIEGGVNGSPRAPLRVTQGTLRVRGVTTPVAGVVTLERGALVVELTPQPAPAGKKPASPVASVVFDTRVWTQR
jgi:serine/threonine-protein kinase